MSVTPVIERRTVTPVVRARPSASPVLPVRDLVAGDSEPAAYEHTQASPASTWTINHNLGVARPSAEVFSVGGVEIDAQVVHTSPNQTVVSFNTPTAGFARISP